MLFNTRSRAQKKSNSNKFFISNEVLPQTIDILKTRANPLDIELVYGNHSEFEFSSDIFGAIVQYPAKNGEIYDYSSFIEKANSVESRVIVSADLMSLALLIPPGEFGAEVVFGVLRNSVKSNGDSLNS